MPWSKDWQKSNSDTLIFCYGQILGISGLYGFEFHELFAHEEQVDCVAGLV